MTIEACPECDSTSMKVNSSNADTDTPRYRCTACNATFDQPATREAKGNQEGLNGLAGKLYRGELSDE